MKYIFYSIDSSENKDHYFDSGQILRFSCLVADDKLNEIERHELTCQYRRDVVPNAAHVLAHQLSPDRCAAGLPEYEFAKAVHRIMMTPNSELVGFQSNAYDDERLRRLYYRNLLDPYAPEWKNSSARFDLERFFSFVHAVKPSLVNWPDGSGVQPSETPMARAYFEQLDLIQLAQRNVPEFEGDTALSTSMQRAEAQFLLYSHFKSHAQTRGILKQVEGMRHKLAVRDAMASSQTPYLLAGYPSQGSDQLFQNSSLLLPICASKYPGGYFLLNLNGLEHLDELMALGDDELVDLFQASYESQVGHLPIVHIKANRCPPLISAYKLKDETIAASGYPSQQVLRETVDACQISVKALRARLTPIAFRDFEANDACPADFNLYGSPLFSFKERDQVDLIHHIPMDQWYSKIKEWLPAPDKQKLASDLARVTIARHDSKLIRQPMYRGEYEAWIDRVIEVYRNPRVTRSALMFDNDITSHADSDPAGVAALKEHFNQYCRPVFDVIRAQYRELNTASGGPANEETPEVDLLKF